MNHSGVRSCCAAQYSSSTVTADRNANANLTPVVLCLCACVLGVFVTGDALYTVLAAST
jgi:hypothetical protein